MKIRTDFVTNSSSSSFTLMIRFNLVDGTSVQFDAQGGGESGRIDYFDCEAYVDVSPKQLGNAKNIDELIKLLEKGVLDGEEKIFDKSRPVETDNYYFDEENEEDSEIPTFDAYDFVKEIREKITDMDQIETITISGDEIGGDFESYERSYTYNLKTKEYTGFVSGSELESEGSSGDLRFSVRGCDIEYDECED